MATDACEPQIIRALEKDGWHITERPLAIVIRRGQEAYLVDFRARRVANGRTEEVLIFEVKCFTHPENDLQEFYTAVGQYHTYLSALEAVQTALPLYLAIPSHAYERIMARQALRVTLERDTIRLLIVDIDREEIVAWIH